MIELGDVSGKVRKWGRLSVRVGGLSERVGRLRERAGWMSD